MSMPMPTRCAAPSIGGRSTYIVLGFIGYAIANLVCAVLMWAWRLTVTERLIATVIPPVAFLAVVTVARRIVGHERIVFYQTSAAGVGAVAIAGALTGAQTARLVDVVTIGIGIFLVFGRLGCFAVACCHGRPARHGIVYGDEHVRVGFWQRWAGRRLWPVQLVESAVSLALVVIALVTGWREPGTPALVYIVAYGAIRFALELVRGDSARPHARGLSEAQWTAPLTLIACALWRPGIATIAVCTITIAAAVVLAVRHRARELWLSPHLRELDRVCVELLAAGTDERRETSLGVAVSCHLLPDGRTDWVLSSTHPAWSPATARRIADALWTSYDVVEGRLPGVAHVIAA
jgi:prolipoprotein diacylglyceryltransferase